MSALSFRVLPSVSLPAVGLVAACTFGGLPAAPAGGTSTPGPAESTNQDRLRIFGTLTRKGPEAEAWWAVTDARGSVWRIEPSGPDQARQFGQWQNRRVVVDGVRNGSVLATPRLRVEQAALVP